MKKRPPMQPQQSKFCRMVTLLITFIELAGYEVTFGDAWAKSGHKKRSLHYIRLAIDLNLFKDGVWLKETKDHAPFGSFWEMMGGSWGGRFGDGNHYELKRSGKQ